MQLLRLQMRNFKRYRHQDVVFRDGITGIVGNNGTGKSTIVEAVLFCLYGVKETGLDHILSATAGPRDRAEARLDFSVHGEEFQILRSLGPRKKHDAQLHRRGKLMAKGVSEVQDAVRRILRMGQADFRHTIFSGQKELLALLDATPEERKRWFRRVLGIDSLKEAGGEILREGARVAREELLLIKGRLAEVSREELEARRSVVEREIVGAEGRIRELREERDRLDVRSVALTKELDSLLEIEKQDFSARNELKRCEEDQAKIEREIARVMAEIDALERNRGEFEELEAGEADYESLRESFTLSTNRFLAYQSLAGREEEKGAHLGEAEAGLGSLRADEERLDRDGERLRTLAPSRGRWEAVRARRAMLRDLGERSQVLRAELARREAAVSELARRGGTLRSRIGHIREARARLDELAGRAGFRVSSGEDPMRFIEDRGSRLLRASAEKGAALDSADAARERLASSLATIEAQGPEGTCPTCRQPLGERHRDLVAGIRDEMDALGTEIASLEKDLAGIRSDLESQGALMREAHDLAKIAGQLGEATGEWEDVQERTLAEISRRERLENEIAALGYDPGEEKALDDELDALEAPMKELAVITDRLEGRQALLEKIRDQEARIRQLQAERAAISRERDELGFDPELHRRLEAEFRSMDERHRRYLDLRPGMNRLQVLEDQAAGLRSRDDMLEKAAAGLRSAIHTIAFSREDLSRAKGDLGSLHQLILEVTSRLEKTRSGKIQLEGERERLDAHLEKVEREKREYDRLSREIELLDLTREHLNGFTDHLLGVVRDQIQEETGRILSEITDGRYDTVILDDAFELLVHDLGGDFPVSRFSGGEQDDVAIALRIALSRNIAEMHELHDSTFLIFDEIFGSQDEERRGNILRALRALEPYFPQIFLISHVTEVQGEFGNTLLVEAVSGTESRIRDLEGVEA